MNILITGGAGYVGGALTDILINFKHNVRVYDNLVYEDEYLKPIDFIYGDIRDRKKLLPQLKWADVVVWLAALVGDGACAVNPEVSKTINQDSLQFLAKNFDGRIIHMSTCSVYGAMDGILTEESKINPLSVYAVTKRNSEDYLKGKNAIIFRLGTLFGPSDTYSRLRLDLVLNILTLKAHYNKKLTVFGGDQFRPLLHVRDVAGEISRHLNTEHTGVYNLGCENIRIIDLAERVKKYFSDVIIEKTELSFEDSRNYRVSWDKAKTVLRFKPKYTIDDGIKSLKKIFEEGRIKNIANVKYSNSHFLNTCKPNTIFDN